MKRIYDMVNNSMNVPLDVIILVYAVFSGAEQNNYYITEYKPGDAVIIVFGSQKMGFDINDSRAVGMLNKWNDTIDSLESAGYFKRVDTSSKASHIDAVWQFDTGRTMEVEAIRKKYGIDTNNPFSCYMHE